MRLGFVCCPARSPGRDRYLGPSRLDISLWLWSVSRGPSSMAFKHSAEKYREAFLYRMCRPKRGYHNVIWNISVLEEPIIQIISTRPISLPIFCTVPSCMTTYTITHIVSTTHSGSPGFLVQAGAKPFGIGIEFTATTGPEFSRRPRERPHSATSPRSSRASPATLHSSSSRL
ncbi:hypothetical protein BG015_009788 [Linnemannia schmuckeri]|uniref:Uncharacterized protein n=1 Tax=Linnemannia schmuckeri TaxID=64567 RepID=A0A9P5RUZ0_9FUNG|nr:hypothetical protein BG015_009788 [Linnemannia schmuckeri]